MPDLGRPQGRPVRGKGAGNNVESIIDTNPKTGVKQVEEAERIRQALELRKAGATYAQIADKLGWDSASGAHYAVSTALKNLPIDGASQLRQVQIERLQTLLAACWAQAVNPSAASKSDPSKTQTAHVHIGYVNTIRGILSDLRDLMGLDLDSGMVDEAKDKGVVVIGGTKEQYLAALDAMARAKEASDILQDAVDNPPPIETTATNGE